ncbi:MAG: hypothetical protein AB1746_05150 [Candidatus Zixiibacteriota bacterium]
MNKKYLMLTTAILFILICLSSAVMAQSKPVQLALFTPVQIFPEDTEISGIRISLLYGRNVAVTGLDWGLVNHTTTGKFLGVQFGLVGMADTDFKGFQNNFVNVVKRDFEGFQWGFVNYAHYANGFQLGFVNYAESMKGLQIGLVNVIKQGGQFPVFPIVNWSF